MAGTVKGTEDAAGFMRRLALFYAAIFFVSGTKTTYLPVWLDALGLTAGEIGLIAATPLFLRIVATPALAFAADRHGDHRLALVALAWFSVLMMLALAGVRGFWLVFALTLALSISSTTIMPLTETIAMDGVRRAGHDYGRMRLWGSITFVLATFLAGVAVSGFGPGVVIWVLLAGGLMTAASAHALPASSGPGGDARAKSGRKLSLADVLALVASGRFLLFLLAVGAIQAAHAMFYTFGVLHWQAQGLTPVMASLLWAIGIVTEVALFAASGKAVRLAGAAGLIVIGGAASVLRWLVMMLDPPLAGLMPVQALHGITYGATHLGAVHFMSANVPPERAGTAQALYSSVTAGIALGGATLAAGALYPAWGGKTYALMAVLAAAGTAAAVWLWHGGDGPRAAAPPH